MTAAHDEKERDAEETGTDKTGTEESGSERDRFVEAISSSESAANADDPPIVDAVDSFAMDKTIQQELPQGVADLNGPDFSANESTDSTSVAPILDPGTSEAAGEFNAAAFVALTSEIAAAEAVPTVTNTISLFNLGLFIAMSPDGRRVYVTGINDGLPGTVTVVDTATDSIVARIPLGGSVASTIIGTGIVVSPDGSRLYTLVADSAGGSLATIDTATNTIVGSPVHVLAHPIVGPASGVFALSPDGRRIYVAGQAEVSPTVTVVDTASNAIVASIPLGMVSVPSLTVSPNNRYVYAGTDAGVFVIDTATNSIVGDPIPALATGYVFSPDGHRLYVAGMNYAGLGIVVVDTASNTQVGQPISVIGRGITTAGNPVSVAITPDGRHVYAGSLYSDDVGIVTVIDATTNTQIGEPIPVSGQPTSLAISADGRRLYVSSGLGTAAVTVIDTATNSIVGEPVDVSGVFLFKLVVTPDGRRVYAPSGATVAVIDTAKDTSGNPSGGGSTPPPPPRQPAKPSGSNGNSGGVNSASVSRGRLAASSGNSATSPAKNSYRTNATSLVDRMPSTTDTVKVEVLRGADGKVRLVVYLSGMTPVDQPGFLPSLTSAAAVRFFGAIPGWAGDPIDAAVERYNPAEIMFVGHSDGGMIAQNYATFGKYRNKVTTLVTFGSPIIQNASPAYQAIHIQAAGDAVPTQLSDRNASLSNAASGRIYPAPPTNVGDKHSLNESYKRAAQDFEWDAKWKDVKANMQRFAGEPIKQNTATPKPVPSPSFPA